jgi:peptidoglycan-N-acetylglucosamine deacetylase
MPHMNRRTLLCAIAAAGLVATIPPPPAAAQPTGGSLPCQPVRPPAGVLTRLPADGNQLALTVDDGNSVSVVGSLVQFCRDSGTRLTFFVNGINSSWTVNAPALRPLVDSGQIQLGNHTWSHPYLTRLGLGAVADQIRRNAEFLRNTYGVDGTPYFRPPYGVHTVEIDRVAAELGYTIITMWSASIGDSRPENETSLIANAAESFQPEQIVVAHANLPTITRCYPQLLDLIHSRGLQTVTLHDVFG